MSEENATVVVNDAVEVETEVETEVEAKTEVVQDDGQAQEEAAPDSLPEEDAEDKPDGVQKRIDKLTGEKYDLQRKLAYYEALGKEETPKPQAAPQEVKSLADFDYDEVAYQAYVNDQAAAKTRQELEAEQAKHQAAERYADFKSREAKFAEKHEDYSAVAHNPALDVNQGMAELIQTAEDGPELGYYLGKNPEIATKLSRLPPLVMAMEMGALRLEINKPKPVELSKTPPPPKKIEATDVKPKLSLGDLSQAEFEKRRRKTIESR